MNTWVYRLLAAVLIVFLLAGLALLALDRFARSNAQDLSTLPRRTVTLHGEPLTLLVADTPATVGPGLSGQDGLSADQGLLLLSPDGDTRVTMLGMRFPLDVVWLDADHRVIAVRKNVPPGRCRCRTHRPRRPWPSSSSPPAGSPATASRSGAPSDDDDA